jgi:copper chaperone NosL
MPVRRHRAAPHASGGLRPATALLFALLASAACATAEPRAVVVGEDQCSFCRMEITEPRFATQVIHTTGKIVMFDAVDCLAGYVRGNDAAGIKSVWVADAASDGDFVRAEEAGFLVDGSLRGPMGRAVAFASPAAAERQREVLGGFTVSWAAFLADSAGVASHDAHAAHGGH